LVDISLTGAGGVKIFDRLNLTLKGGETAFINGSSGDGTTSLVRLLIGNIGPDSGTVLVFGEKIITGKERRLNRIRKKIGGVGGIYQPISYLTIYENLSYPLLLRGDGSSKRNRKVGQVLSMFNLTGRKWTEVSQLSRGEKILLMLARGMIADQPLLLIEEPLAGLGPEMSSRVSQALLRLSLSGHSMVILSSGKTEVDLPGAGEYLLKNGQLQ
jgi:ABC-type multidrug transport system ATPase subunit